MRNKNTNNNFFSLLVRSSCCCLCCGGDDEILRLMRQRRTHITQKAEADTMADGYSNIDNSRNVNDLDSSSSGDAYIFFSRNDVSVQEEKTTVTMLRKLAGSY